MEKNKTLKLTQIAMLSAVIIIMALTPLGYLRIGPVAITFLTVPVVIGGILLGPSTGAVLGAVFGLTSLAQCFGMDQFGTTLFGISPIFTIIVCLIPRILIGITSGFASRAFKKANMNITLSYAISGFIGVITNTVFFVGLLIALFGRTEYIQSFGSSIRAIIGVLVTTNSAIEVVVCTLLVTIIARACFEGIKKRK